MKKYFAVVVFLFALSSCNKSNNDGQIPQNQSDETGVYNDQSNEGPTLSSVTCDIHETGMYSDVQGSYYSWTYWNNWSDGSRTVNNLGQGYDPPYDC